MGLCRLAFACRRTRSGSLICEPCRRRYARCKNAGQLDFCSSGELLRPRRERPHGRRGAEQRDEVAPFHCRTSPFRASEQRIARLSMAAAALRDFNPGYDRLGVIRVDWASDGSRLVPRFQTLMCHWQTSRGALHHSRNGIYGMLPDQSAFAPANLITLAHFSVSSAINFLKSAGEATNTV